MARRMRKMEKGLVGPVWIRHSLIDKYMEIKNRPGLHGMNRDDNTMTLEEVVHEYIQSLPKRKISRMKHLKKIAYNAVQFRMKEVLIAGLTFGLSTAILADSWIPVPLAFLSAFVGALISEHRKLK